MRLLITCLFTAILFGQIPLKYENNETPTYDQAIHWYKVLDTTYDNAHLLKYGDTDSGKPLHLFIISSVPGRVPNPKIYREQGKSMLLIVNAIHAGESCGVDASIRFAENLLMQDSIPDNVVIGIIPIYNIGGVLNRNSTTRANQNGPQVYGFRGNARNLDLNRDFIKADSKNAKTFTTIFQEWKPDILIDTHTSDGADFQHIMTFLGSNSQNYPPTMRQFIEITLIPGLYSWMEKKGYPIIPYVIPLGDTPESGIWAGIDPPRFSSGYAALFNTLAFISEAHMLKPYKDRVKSTLSFLQSILNIMKNNTPELLSIKNEANNFARSKDEFVLTWEMDSTRFDKVLFLGYEAKYKPSRVTGQKRLFYDRSSPYQKQIPVAVYSNAIVTVNKPYYYIIPQGWSEVIERLDLNQIQLYTLSKDTL
ncbi:MAG: M14 family zinc carboxypeptidase, partial [Candidatus Neomarinimicrobiota bacterium]